MIVAMRLEDIGGVKGLHPVEHHSAPDAAHDADRQAGLVPLARCHVIDAVLGEEVRPALDLPVVERVGIIIEQVLDLLPHRRVETHRRDAGHLVHGSKSHDAAIAVPEAAHRGLRRARVLLRAHLAAAHFQERGRLRTRPRAALHELVDAAVFERDEPGSAGEVALQHPHLRLFLAVALVAEIDPEQLGLIHAARREETDRERVQRELDTEVRKDGLDAVGDAVVELVPRLQQPGPGQRRVVAGGMHFRVPVLLGLGHVGAPREADVMPLAIREHDAAVHVETVDLERGVEGVQQGGVVGIAQVLGIELPVVVDDLAVGAEDAQRPAEIARDELRHLGAEIALDRCDVVAKRAEHHAAECLDLQRLEPMVLGLEIARHAALPADAVAEGDAAQAAVEVVVPGVIDAAQARDVVLLLQAHQRALVGATVHHRVDRAIVVARDHHRRLSDGRGAIVARIGDLDLEAEKAPHRPAEDALLLERVDLRIGEQPERRAHHALSLIHI